MAHLLLTAKQRAKTHRALMPIATVEESYKSFLSQSLTRETVQQVEQITRGQRDNPVWHELRKGVVTASSFLDVIEGTEWVDRDFWEPWRHEVPLNKILTGSCEDNPAMEWGRERREVALMKYWNEHCSHLHKTHELRRPGLYLSRDNPLVGASPVAIVYQKNAPQKPLFLVHVKCPYSRRYEDPQDAASRIGKVTRKGDLIIERKHTVSYQIQALMGVTRVEHCALVVYTKKGICVGQVELDVGFFKKIMRQVGFFTREYLYPKLFE